MSKRANGRQTLTGSRSAAPGLRARVAAALVGGLAVAATPACDTNARFNPNQTVFQDLVVVSAYPAVQQNGKLVRQCSMDPVAGGDPDGFLVNFVMVSSQRKGRPGSNEAHDEDNSIRPGDIINSVEVLGSRQNDIKINQSTVDFTISCIDQHANDVANSCANTTSLKASGIDYAAFAKSRSSALTAGHNILVLIDDSASIRGLVKDSDQKEGTPGTFDPAPNFSQVASDYTHRRISVVDEFIDKLNSSDRVGVLAFGEGIGSGADNLLAPCALPEVEGQPWDVALDTCFGRSNVNIWKNGLTNLRTSTGGGRSNLWHAVNQAYGFLTQKRDLNRTNHIVVLTDGPDTCLRDSEAFTSCDVGACNSEKVTEIIRRIEEDGANPNVPPVHIHFVQFESPGYPGPDPRQQEIACLTNGHYQFINSNKLSLVNVVDFQNALSTAMNNVRLSLQGVWQAAIPAPEFKQNSAPPVGTPRGGMYALKGLVDIQASSNLVKAGQQTKTFQNSGGNTWDRRLVVRKPCGADTDCGLDGDGVCKVGCSEETQLCRNQLDLPNNMACQDGSGGTCCDGECVAGGSVCGTCSK